MTDSTNAGLAQRAIFVGERSSFITLASSSYKFGSRHVPIVEHCNTEDNYFYRFTSQTKIISDKTTKAICLNPVKTTGTPNIRTLFQFIKQNDHGC